MDVVIVLHKYLVVSLYLNPPTQMAPTFLINYCALLKLIPSAGLLSSSFMSPDYRDLSLPDIINKSSEEKQWNQQLPNYLLSISARPYCWILRHTWSIKFNKLRIT